MRPEKLTVQAFGPFTGREEIDFTRFGEQPMILINGPTGAGKSTILDALCFALYGQTSGGDREAGHMRSQQAEAKLISEVDLTFSLGQERWRVHRVPAQLRPKQKGEGQTRQNPQATLWRLEGDLETVEVPRGVEEVTQFVKELTGLNADQFRQVMVLPQGRFRELLVAPSKKREEIFSTLFDSGIYKQLENALKEKASNLRKQVDALSNQNQGVLKSAGMRSREEVAQVVEHLSPIVTSMTQRQQSELKRRDQAREAVKLAERLISDISLAASAQQEVERLEAISQTINKDRTRQVRAQSALHLEQEYQLLISAQERLHTSSSDVEKHKQTLFHAKAALETAEQKCQTAHAEKNKIPGLQTELQRLQKVQETQAELISRRQKLSQAEAQAETATAAQIAASSALDERRSQASFKQKKVEQDRTKILQLGEVQANLAGLNEAVKKIDELNSAKSQLDALETQLRQHTKSKTAANEQVKHDVKKLTELEYRWHAGQARLLALTLNAGTACPVCGSTEHPAPCAESAENDLVEQSQIEHARKTLETQRLELQKHESVCQKLADDSARIKIDVDRHALELRQFSDENEHQLKNRLANQLKQLRELETMRDALPQAESTLKTALEQIRVDEIAFGEKREIAAGALTAKKQAESEYQQVLKQIPEQHRDQAALNNSLDALSLQIRLIGERVDTAENALRDAQLEYTKQTTRADSLAKAVTTDTEKLQNVQLSWDRILEHSDFTDEADFKRSVLPPSELNQLLEKIQSHDQLLHKARGAAAAASVAIENKTQPDLIALQTSAERAENQLRDTEEAQKKEQEQLNVLLSVQTALDGNDHAEKKLHGQYAVAGRLSDIATGQSNSKISLQRYVLSVLLDDVLLDASRRMREMSRQRYELVRRQDTTGGRRAAGLELDVIDAWSGKSRPVSTLSGGESFQAALALALGLSEVVQAYAGGVRLDTLFIDEGFGSLDTDALERAIEMLVDLQATGRMIGVISHVTEMKEQIAQRLDVVPSLSGSRIEMQV